MRHYSTATHGPPTSEATKTAARVTADGKAVHLTGTASAIDF